MSSYAYGKGEVCDIAVGVILSGAAAPLIGDYHHRGYITLIVAV